MATNDSEIDGLRDAIVAYLEGLDDFAGTTVLGNKPADLLNQCAETLESLGIYTLISIPKGVGTPRQSKRPILDPVHVYVLVREDPLMNHTGKNCTFLSERAYAALQWWKPEIEGGYLLSLAPEGMQEVPMKLKDEASGSELEVHSWELLFHTKLALRPAN